LRQIAKRTLFIIGLLAAIFVALTVRITDTCDYIQLRSLISPDAEFRVVEEQMRCTSGIFETNVWLSKVGSNNKRINLLTAPMRSNPNREGKTPVLQLDISWLNSRRILLAYPEEVDAKTFSGEHQGVVVETIKGKILHP
jgi:hypothetical protein